MSFFKRDEKDTSTLTLVKFTLPIIVSLLAAFLLAVLLLPVAFSSNNLVLSVLGIALVAIFALGALIYGLYVLIRYGRKADQSLGLLKDQMDAFSKGDIVISDRHHESPALDAFQKSLNETIETYSSFRVVFEDGPSDRLLREQILTGVVFPYEEFQRLLFREVQSNLAFRSSLVYVQSLGPQSAEEETMSSLHMAIVKAFPKALVGRIDDTTFGVYVYSLESFLAFETKLSRLVNGYQHMPSGVDEDLVLLSFCKVGAVVYPYTPITSLMSEAAAALAKSEDVYLNEGISAVSYPHAIITEMNKRIVYLATLENYEHAIKRAPDFISEVASLKRYAAWCTAVAGFEVGGLLSYIPETNEYQILYEVGKDEKETSFSKLGERIPSHVLEPLFRVAEKDPIFACDDVEQLPGNLSGFLMNLGVRSFYFQSVTSYGSKRGFLYFTSKTVSPEMTLLSRDILSRYVAGASAALVAMQEKEKQKQTSSLFEALSDHSRQYLYSIDRPSHRITYMSDNLQKAFPEAKIGSLCYKALRGERASCAHCPLKRGAEHKIIDRLANTEMTISLLQARGTDENQSTILMEGSAPSLANDNRFLDPVLAIKNRQALSLDLSHQIKLEAEGYLLSIRLVNSDALLKQAPDATCDVIMSAVAKNVRDAGYGEQVYRSGDYDLSFLLKSLPASKLINFVEEVAEIMQSQLVFQFVSLTPQFAYAAVGYPSDAQSAREVLDLSESELSRSADFGVGYLTQVADHHPRKALRDDFIAELLQKTFDRGIMPIEIQPLIETKTLRTVSGDILARLYGPGGVEIPSGEFILFAARHALIDRVDIGALNSAARLYETYGENYFKSSQINGFSVRISPLALKSPRFPEDVKKLYEHYKMPKGYLHFLLDARDVKAGESDLRRAMLALGELGVVFEISGVNPESISLDYLKELGISHIRTEISLIAEAVTNPNDYATLARFVRAAQKDGFVMTCSGIENKEMLEMAAHLEIPFCSGYFFSKPLLENDFVQYIAFHK
jgi:EAL domain-containing protein (putative c-di-GMP-specific phosphodiesterase class I)